MLILFASIEGKTNVEAENVQETCNTYNGPSKNTQQTPSNIEDIANQTPIEKSEPSNNVPEVSKCQQEDITSDTGTDQSKSVGVKLASDSNDGQEKLTSPEPSQTSLPMHRIKTKTNEQPSSEEWQIFAKLEDVERQSGQFIETSVPQEKFHNALESSGKFVVGDIPEIIKGMNLETVCIEKDGQYIDCYRRKGE